jgi:hypothetical protein
MTARTKNVQFTTNVAVTAAAETVIATLSGVSTPRAVTVTLRGWVEMITGTATTAVTLRVRRGTDATGTLIDEGNPVTIGAAVGSTEEFSIVATDDGADLAGASYVLTAQQSAATADGSALQGSLEASWTN